MLHVLRQFEATIPSLSGQIGFDIGRQVDGYGHEGTPALQLQDIAVSPPGEDLVPGSSMGELAGSPGSIFENTTDPAQAQWRETPEVTIAQDAFGRPSPTAADAVPLWDWDVVEAFVGSELDHVGYSKFAVRARVDRERHVWYGEMRMPFEALGVKGPKAGLELRAGLYRCAGRAPNRVYYAWSATGQRTFHVPEAFGLLRLR